MLDHIAPMLENYIWQREPFLLHLFPGPHTPPWLQPHQRSRKGKEAEAPWSGDGATRVQPAAPSFLWGSVNFGENTEDEWFITWLLLEITRKFPVSARVWDNDGEFLLIEAAYSLPRWLKPEVAVNRVWLHGGRVHLVPLPKTPGQPAEWGKKTLTAAHALHAVHNATDITAAAGKDINDALALRLNEYPQRTKEMMHRAVAVVPARLAHVLRKCPQSVAAGVEAFHYRDPYDTRIARTMPYFPPHDLIRINVRFSRCLYAQIALQEYTAPKAWPPLRPTSHPDHPAALLGVKLAAGYEMWLNKDAAGASEPSPAAHAVLEALDESLDIASFDQGESVLPSESDAWLREAPSIMEAELQRREAEVHAEELRRQQQQQSTAGPTSMGDGLMGQTSSEFDPGELSSKMKAFVDASSGLEGAELPMNINSNKHLDSGKSRGASTTAEFEAEFNEARFFAELEKVLGMASSSLRNFDHPRHHHQDPGSKNQNQNQDADDDGTSSSDEGSSFYSHGSSESESDLDWEAEEKKEAEQPSSRGGASDCRPRGTSRSVSGGERSHRGDPSYPFRDPGTASQHDTAAWETATATDSDDADDFEFMESYDAALAKQLAGTSLAHTFATAEQVAAAASLPEGGVGSLGAASGGRAAAMGPRSSSGQFRAKSSALPDKGQGDEEREQAEGEGYQMDEEEEVIEEEEEGVGTMLQPLDIDANLIASLLASYKEQGGLPGPASTLAGLLGVRLPDPE